jgi:hypothetical protein
MTTNTTTKIRLPRPVYAVAGAGEAAYRRLVRLPRLAELRAELTEVPARVEALRTALRTDLPARVEQRVTTLVAEAREVYTGLVARGERVVNGAGGEPTVIDGAVTARTETPLAQPAATAVRETPRKVARKATRPAAAPADKPAPRAVKATRRPKA